MSNVLPGLKYSKEHEWVKVDGGTATIGITDHAQHALGDIVFVELPKPGAAVAFMKPMGVIDSVKASSEIFSPLNGKVTEANGKLSASPELLNQDCYDEGWIAKVEIAAGETFKELMDDAAYKAYLATL